MDYSKQSCRDFLAALASSAPVPGGGGAAAITGSIGVALGAMVGNLTVDKPDYAPQRARLQELIGQCTAMQEALLDQVNADAEGFAPLSRAYAIPRSSPSRDEILQNASVMACTVPLRIMALCAQSMRLVSELAEQGTRSARSDAVGGLILLKASLQSAALNVFANTRVLHNRAQADALNRQCTDFLREYMPMADQAFSAFLTSCIE
jgi:formiminotetrahydrofolate cyclodeaminase